MGKRRAPNQKITKYIGVKDINTYLKKVTDLGGTILMPRTTIPGFGYLVTFLDTEGNALGLWETEESATFDE